MLSGYEMGIKQNKTKKKQGKRKKLPLTFLEQDNLLLFMLCSCEMPTGGSTHSKKGLFHQR